MPDRLLSVRNLQVAFGNRVVLRDLSFEVNSETASPSSDRTAPERAYC